MTPYQRVTVRRPGHPDRVVDDALSLSAHTPPGAHHSTLVVLRASGDAETFPGPYSVSYGEPRASGCCGEPAPDA